VTVSIPENGPWTDLLSDWTPTVSKNRLDFEVGSNRGHVLFR
jgi:hypothetical protein